MTVEAINDPAESSLIEPTVAEKKETNRYLIDTFAEKYNLPPNGVITILSATAFRLDKDGNAPTFEQITALIVVCLAYGLNPFTKEIFAFPDKHKGVIPVVSVDGWLRIINERKELDGFEFCYSESLALPEDSGLRGLKHAAHEWIECVIYRKDRSRPIVAREYLDECYRPPGNYGDGPWQSHTNRFLRHKALIQCARMAFGFAGIYDDDEAQRILREPGDDEPGTTADVIQMPTRKAPASTFASAPQVMQKRVAQGEAIESLKNEREQVDLAADKPLVPTEERIDRDTGEITQIAVSPPQEEKPARVQVSSAAPAEAKAEPVVPQKRIDYLRMRMEFNGVSEDRLDAEFKGGIAGITTMAQFVAISNWVEKFEAA